jgi:hypothetical protein
MLTTTLILELLALGVLLAFLGTEIAIFSLSELLSRYAATEEP